MGDTFETLAFFRGLNRDKVIETPVLNQVRRDRKPRNMSTEIHQRADCWFEEKFSIRYRSQAIFVTSALLTAQSYAMPPENVVRVIPLGKYSYCWSPKRSDLLFYLSSPQTISIEDYLDESDYTQEDLKEAHQSGNEVMLFCDQYLAIPINLLTNTEQEKSQNTLILLPS